MVAIHVQNEALHKSAVHDDGGRAGIAAKATAPPTLRQRSPQQRQRGALRLVRRDAYKKAAPTSVADEEEVLICGHGHAVRAAEPVLTARLVFDGNLKENASGSPLANNRAFVP